MPGHEVAPGWGGSLKEQCGHNRLAGVTAKARIACDTAIPIRSESLPCNLLEIQVPLVKFDIIEGRSEAEINVMLDAAHRALLKAFNVPERDRYQIVSEHKPSRLVVEDTGLGIPRTNNVVIVSVVSRPRSEESKRAFYAELSREFQASCGIDPNDVMVSVTINSDADWSFGNGVAQFLTGEL
jgi:hypothetical protein